MHSTQITDDEMVSLAGVAASSSPVRRSGQPVILPLLQGPVAAASMALEDASSSDWDVPPTIGELAIRLVADWSLPRLVVMAVKGREEP